LTGDAPSYVAQPADLVPRETSYDRTCLLK